MRSKRRRRIRSSWLRGLIGSRPPMKRPLRPGRKRRGDIGHLGNLSQLSSVRTGRRAAAAVRGRAERLGKEKLVRLVAGPDGMLVPDIEERLPGRGLWITAPAGYSRACRDQAALGPRRRSRDRGTAPDLADRIAALLTRRCLELVGLARRAGQAVAGFEKVKAALERGDVALLLQAADGSPEQRAKLMPRRAATR